jgi:hypothetical protein
MKNSLTGITWLNSRVGNHRLAEVKMRMVVRSVFLSSSRVGTMQIKLAFLIVERELPAIQITLASRLEEGPKHPVGRSGLQNGVDDKST